MSNNPLLLVSSQYKHLPGRTAADIAPHVISRGSTMKNEPFSFQALYRCSGGHSCVPVSVSAVCDGLPIDAWRVDCVPLLSAANPLGDPGYVSDAPGAYPDMLMPRPANPEVIRVRTAWNAMLFEKDTDNLLNALPDAYQSVWFTVNPDSETLTAGIYDITVKLHNLSSDETTEQTLTLEIIDAALPEHAVYYTNWFYEDCLCDMFGVKLYSDEFYAIFDEYIQNMTRHRQNVLLLPAFTPPLDTPVGEERMNVQLTDIERDGDGWRFGFERMRRFVRHAKTGGIRYFEHCHLFSQWGAKNAPNIYGTAGERLFGFDTDAAGEEYVRFIRAYLTAFLAFAKEEGIENNLIFHISDEPSEAHLDSYRAAHDAVADLLAGHPTADAMSSVKFYEEGLVSQPIPHIRHADEFEKTCGSFWLYYTGHPGHSRCTNRLISNTSARTRVLGVQMYRYKALGFLQWAYNFYYDRLSAGIVDPRSNPGGYKQIPGAAFLAYPLPGGGKHHVAPSIREKLMAEAMDDLRALKLLESRIGRAAVLALCEKFLGEPITNELIPEGDALYALRMLINEKIKETI